MGYLWSPWHGCHKCSPGCKNCYVFYLDKTRDKDANIVTKSKTNFNLPLKKNRAGEYKLPAGSEIATCFTSDFFIEEADEWRAEAWEIIKKRPDLKFLICTKRVERILNCLPEDWDLGYDNVAIAVTCETQAMADRRIPIFLTVPVKKRFIFIAPILEYVDLSQYLGSGLIDRVAVGGESYSNARVCDFDWVSKIFKTCKDHGVEFDFHQTGTNLKKGEKIYSIKHREEYSQAKKAEEYLKKFYQ